MAEFGLIFKWRKCGVLKLFDSTNTKEEQNKNFAKKQNPWKKQFGLDEVKASINPFENSDLTTRRVASSFLLI